MKKKSQKRINQTMKKKSPRKKQKNRSLYHDGVNVKNVITGALLLTGSRLPFASTPTLSSEVSVPFPPLVPSVHLPPVPETVKNISLLLGIDNSTITIEDSSLFHVVHISTGLESLITRDENNKKAASHRSRHNPNLYLKIFPKKTKEEVEIEEWYKKYEFNDVEYDKEKYEKYENLKAEDIKLGKHFGKFDIKQMNEYMSNIKRLGSISSHVYQYEPYILDTTEGYVLISKKVDGIPLWDYFKNIVKSCNPEDPKSELELIKAVKLILTQLHDIRQDLLSKAKFVHNDPHFWNIVINESTKHLTFIDIEPKSFDETIDDDLLLYFNGKVENNIYWLFLDESKLSSETQKTIKNLWKIVVEENNKDGGGCILS